MPKTTEAAYVPANTHEREHIPPREMTETLVAILQLKSSLEDLEHHVAVSLDGLQVEVFVYWRTAGPTDRKAWNAFRRQQKLFRLNVLTALAEMEEAARRVSASGDGPSGFRNRWPAGGAANRPEPVA